MKIGIYDPYLDDIGGGERYMMTIASCLSIDNPVDVFWDESSDLKKIEDRFSLDLSKVSLTKNIFSKSVSFSKKMLASSKYDAIIVLSDGSIPILLSKKLFLHVQQPITTNVSLKDRAKLKKVNKIFCNSNYTKNFIDTTYGVKSEVLYPPVSIFGYTESKENIILHVGRFRVLNVKTMDYKKQQVMINEFKKLVDKGLKAWKFVLAISLNNEKDESFLKMRRSAGGYPIEFLINSRKDDLWKIGSKAKIYWHASGYGEDLEKHPEFAEHFGISTVEAMGVGAVPVVFNAGGQKEIVRDGENGFLWNSLSELEEKTSKLVGDEKLLQTLSKKAYDSSLGFSEESFCKKINALIK